MFLLLVGGAGQASSAHWAGMVFTLLAMMVAGRFCIDRCGACSLDSASSQYLIAPTFYHLTLSCSGGTHFSSSSHGRLACRVAVTGSCGVSIVHGDVGDDLLCRTLNKEVYAGGARTVDAMEGWCGQCIW